MSEEKKKKPSFEERLNELQGIVAKIEGQTIPLEESLKLFERGQALIKSLESDLEEAEKKIGKYQIADAKEESQD